MKIKTLPIVALLASFLLSPLAAQNFEVYVSDAGNFNLPPWQILKFDQNGENGQVFISDHLAWPQDIFFLENENAVLISNLNTNVISKFNATTGAYIGEFATGIAGPTRIAIGPDSLLYVLQWQGNGKVKRYHLDGSFMDDFTASGVGTSIGLDWDANGNLYVSSYNGKFIRKFSPTGADLGNFISTNLAGPTNIWFADNGELFVNDYNAGSIKRFDSQGNYLGVFATGVPQAEGVDFFPNGDLAVGVGGTSSVKVFSANGSFVKNLVQPSTLGLLVPNAVVFRPVSPNPTNEVFKDISFVKPSVGIYFHVSNPDATHPASSFEVFNSAGYLVQKVNFADSTTWDASNLANGIYHITAKLSDGTIARQKVVVQQQ